MPRQLRIISTLLRPDIPSVHLEVIPRSLPCHGLSLPIKHRFLAFGPTSTCPGAPSRRRTGIDNFAQPTGSFDLCLAFFAYGRGWRIDVPMAKLMYRGGVLPPEAAVNFLDVLHIVRVRLRPC